MHAVATNSPPPFTSSNPLSTHYLPLLQPPPSFHTQESGSWGSKLKLDVSKPILGLATHPLDPALLLLLHADGGLRCYQVWTPSHPSPHFHIHASPHRHLSTPPGPISL